MSIRDMLMKLKVAFPDAVVETLRKGKDGKVAPDYAVATEFIDLLRGGDLGLADGEQQRYELQFPGKRMARANAVMPCHKTMRPMREQSKNFADTGNVFVEGDNLDALKLMKHCYRGRVNVIYIDPPYNTGGDGFVYNDDFSVSQTRYMLDAGIIDEDGERQIREVQNGLRGRFHAGWLAFMYPRLKLARELLADDGVIFISIDDNEMANLKLICDEIFGEENFVNTIIWQRASGGGVAKGIITGHDYVLVYQKSQDADINYFGDKVNKGRYAKDKIIKKDGRTFFVNDDVVRKKFGKYENGTERRCYYEELGDYKNPKQIGEIQARIDAGEYILRRQSNGKHFICELIEQGARTRMYSIIQGVLNNHGKEDLEKLAFPVFEYPKPVALMEKIISATGNKNGVFMDFFAGSASTAHAVMKLNAEDGGTRRFVLVQWAEEIDKKSSAEAHRFCTEALKRPANIAEIAKERIRRAGKKIREENPQWQGDDGFRVYAIADSVLYDKADDNTLADTGRGNLVRHKKPLKAGNFDAILMEVMLQTGTPPDKPVFTGEEEGYPFAICEGKCYCITENLAEAAARQIAEKHGDKFDMFYYLSDALGAETSYTQIESALTKYAKQAQILTLT